MKRLHWKTTALIAGILLLCSGIVAHEESGDGTLETTSGIPYEPQILKYGLENLNTLKRVLPDLHSKVISPDWMEMRGSDRLRLVVGSMTNVWGVNDEDIDDYLSRFDQYESNVPPEEKGDVELIFGLIGDQLLRLFFSIEQSKESTQALVDAYSILWEDDDPGKLVEYERCLGQTVVAMGVNTMKTFDDWLDGVEGIAASADMVASHVILHSKTTSEWVKSVSIESSEAQQKCNPDWEADS